MESEGEKENQSCLELLELLAVLLCLEVLDLQDVELDGLGEGTALTDGHTITLLNVETRRAVDSHGGVTLLIPVVLGDVVKVITTDDDGALHLGGANDASKNATTNADVGSEGALLIDVIGLDSSLGGFETKTDLLVEAHGLTLGLLASHLSKDASATLAEHHLTLISPLNLNVCHPIRNTQKTKQKKNNKQKKSQNKKKKNN